MPAQITVKRINDGQVLVSCPAHGMHIISRGEWANEVLLNKRNPCRDCRAESETSGAGEMQAAATAPEKYARKHAGWRMLELGRGMLHPETLDRTGVDVFLSLVTDARTWHPIYFPNRMEANLFRIYLKMQQLELIDCFIYQPEPIDFASFGETRGVTRYRPDFLLFLNQRMWYVEAKGRMDPKSLTRLRLLRRHRPDIILDIVTSQKVIRKYRPQFQRYESCWIWGWLPWSEKVDRWRAMCPGWER